MDITTFHAQATTELLPLIEKTQLSDMEKQTPCEAWNIRALCNHLIMGLDLYALVASNQSVENYDYKADLCGDNPTIEFSRAAQACERAFSSLDLTNNSLALPWGTFPAKAAVSMHTLDVVVHSWDLAQTLSLDYQPSDELVATALLCAKTIPDSFRGPNLPFHERQQLPENPSDFDLLLIDTGRNPAWQPAD